MMHRKKLILVTCLLIVLITQKSFAQETKRLSQIEYIQQRVKSIVETTHLKNRVLKIRKKITPEFDNNHVFEHCMIGGDTNVNRAIKYFDDKYVKPGKDQDTIGIHNVDRISGTTAEIVGIDCLLKNDSLYCRNVFKFGKYDLNDNMTEFRIYDSADNLVFKQCYIFNDKEFLIEVDNYSNDNQITERTVFRYTAFDRKGNWIKRVEIRKSQNGKIIKFVKTDRKISYF
jgi:hypothetical protein